MRASFVVVLALVSGASCGTGTVGGGAAESAADGGDHDTGTGADSGASGDDATTDANSGDSTGDDVASEDDWGSSPGRAAWAEARVVTATEGNELGEVYRAMWLPDGEALVYSGYDSTGGSIGLYRYDMATGAHVSLAGPHSSHSLGVVALAGAKPALYSSSASRLVFLADADEPLAYELYSVGSDGSDRVRLGRPLRAGAVAWLTPNEQTVVFRVAREGAAAVADLVAVPVTGGAPVALSAGLPGVGPGEDSDPVFTPDSLTVVFRTEGDILWAVGLDGSLQVPLNGDATAPHGVSCVGSRGTPYVLARGGTRVVYLAREGLLADQGVFSVGLDGTGRTRLSRSLVTGEELACGGYVDASLTVHAAHDGSRVVYGIKTGSDIRLHSADVETGAHVELGGLAVAAGVVPRFSPDDATLAFATKAGAVSAIDVVTGANVRQLSAGPIVEPAFGVDVLLTFAPDGERLFFFTDANGDGHSELRSVPRNGGPAVALSAANATTYAASCGGKYIGDRQPLGFVGDGASARVVYCTEGSAGEVRSARLDGTDVLAIGATHASDEEGIDILLTRPGSLDVVYVRRDYVHWIEEVTWRVGRASADVAASEAELPVLRPGLMRDAAGVYVDPRSGRLFFEERRLLNWEQKLSRFGARFGVVDAAGATIDLTQGLVHEGLMLAPFMAGPDHVVVMAMSTYLWGGVFPMPAYRLYSFDFVSGERWDINSSASLSSVYVFGVTYEGSTIALYGENATRESVFVADLAAKTLIDVVPGAATSVDVNSPSFITQDGARVVLWAELSGSWGLYSVRTDGSEWRKLSGSLAVKTGGGSDYPGEYVLTSDSSRVVFVAAETPTSPPNLYVAPLDGSTSATKLTSLGAGVVFERAGGSHFHVTPDDTRVVYFPERSSGAAVARSVRLDGAGDVVLSELDDLWGGSALEPLFTPDSQWVVVVDDDDRLFSARVDGSEVHELAVTTRGAGSAVRWLDRMGTSGTHVACVVVRDDALPYVGAELVVAAIDGTGVVSVTGDDPTRNVGMSYPGGYSVVMQVLPVDDELYFVGDVFHDDVFEVARWTRTTGTIDRVAPALPYGRGARRVQVDPVVGRVYVAADALTPGVNEVFAFPVP